MTSESIPKYHHGDLPAALINATVDMITQQGVNSVTMRHLSEWLGVSRTAAYRHFKNKEALLTATAASGFKQFTADLHRSRFSEPHDPITQFRKMGKAYLQFAIENPAYYRLMFGDMVTQESKDLSEASESAFNELLLMIETLQSSGCIAVKPPSIQAIYIWSLMHGLAGIVINNKLEDNENIDDILAFFDNTTLAGLQ